MCPDVTEHPKRPLPSRDEIVAEAREWIGTPYLHLQREKGRFADCVGLVIGVARRFGLGDYRKRDYRETPDPDHMNENLLHNLDPIEPRSVQPGDILWFALNHPALRKPIPRHLAILANHPEGGLSIIHAYAEAGRVVEHRYSAKWRRRLYGAFRYRGIE
jgi:NlpC/P60 family putative phage cell wall peptidase